MPPDPKPARLRQRRNHVPGEALLPAEGRQEPAPRLPDALFWVAWTHQYWAKIWSSPMATRWSEFDVPTLVRLAKLQQDCLIDGDNRKLAEIRQLEDRFGLSPRGRRLLGWEIAPAEATEHDAVDEPDAPPGADDTSAPAKVIDIDPRRLRRASSA